ncbi:MAG TPA: EAL domain-containing protein [Gaiellaceae bacterium]|nr:EAL domain-containing protein [Gaiellaceae bacterium]
MGLRPTGPRDPESRREAAPPSSFAAALLDAQPASSGHILRLRLLPGSIAVVVACSFLSWLGERSHLFNAWLGLGAFTALMVAAITLLVSQAARLADDAEARRRALEAHYQRLVEQLPLVVYVDELTDNSSNIYTSPQVESLLGYTVEEWVSDPDLFVKVLHPHDRERVLEEVHRSNTEGTPFSTEYRVITKDGRTVWIRDESTFYHERGEAVHSQGYMLDITRRRQAEEELRRLASSDALTSLPNRTLLTERLREGGSDVARSLLFLDLDDFKTINDSLGHREGDRVLVELAHRIGEAVRADDLVARIGGDEFAVLAQTADDATLELLAERLLAAVRTPLLLDGRELRLSASIGIATGGAAEDLLRNADLAMYAAKRRGGDAYACFAPEMHAAADRRLALLAEVARPGLLDELVLHYQPTFDLRDGAIEGVEALLRWQHPAHGLLAPGTFIAAAEESGAIVGIGRWVLREACREAAAWAGACGRGPIVAVNVSGRQLREPGFVADVSTALAGAGLPACALRLELTESVLLDATETARANLAAASDLGVELAIDDFGVGHSWIGNLQELAPNVLKIDRSFMVDAAGGDSPLLRGLLALARELGLKVVVEGIENEEQLTAVRRLHCDAGQGFHLARPMQADALRGLLEREHRLPNVALRLA